MVAETPNIAPTGGWQTWQDVTMDLPDTVPDGTHRLFVVFRHPTATGSLLNLNWFRFAGKGAAVTAPPEVTAAAEPASGEAPLEVAFDAEATDAEGEALTYAWDFGVSGTTADTSTDEDPTLHLREPGQLHGDRDGHRRLRRQASRVGRGPRDAAAGAVPDRAGALGRVRRHLARHRAAGPSCGRTRSNPLSVSGGKLNLPIANGSMYGAGTTAENLDRPARARRGRVDGDGEDRRARR